MSGHTATLRRTASTCAADSVSTAPRLSPAYAPALISHSESVMVAWSDTTSEVTSVRCIASGDTQRARRSRCQERHLQRQQFQTARPLFQLLSNLTNPSCEPQVAGSTAPFL